MSSRCLRATRRTPSDRSRTETYLSLEAQRGTFDWLGAAREARVAVRLGDRSSVMTVAALTPKLAELLQLPLTKGVVISHRVWENELGSDPDARNTKIRVDGRESPVAGIAPDWLDGIYLGSAVDIWSSFEEARFRRAIDPAGSSGRSASFAPARRSVRRRPP